MPKVIEVRPENVFAKSELKFKSIPVNAYDKSIDEEKKLFSKEDFLQFIMICVSSGNLKQFEQNKDLR
jgi:hypothetical protein